MTQGQQIEISQEERQHFAEKLEQFKQTLTQNERQMLEAIVNTAMLAVVEKSGSEVSGYDFADEGGGLNFGFLISNATFGVGETGLATTSISGLESGSGQTST